MPISYVLGPTPRLQFTLNNGQWNAFGSLRTLDWNTRQPKATYHDPGGLIPYPTNLPLDNVGRSPGLVYWEDTSSYFLQLLDRFGNEVWSSPVPYIPANSGGGGTVTTAIEIENLFINGQFRFFPVEGYSPLPDSIPDLADGGWSFRKDGTNTTDSIHFRKFTPDNNSVDASPVYYLNYVSTGAGVGETFKDIVFTIRDVKSLANEQVTVAMNARSALAGMYDIEVKAIQHFGSPSPGVMPSADVITDITTFVVDSTATDFTGTATLPDLTGKTVGENGDDKLEILFRLPLNINANLELTNAYFKRGASVVGYPYETADQVDAIIKALEIPDHASLTDFAADMTTYSSEQAYNSLTLMPSPNNILVPQWLPAVPVGATLDWLTETVPVGWVGLEGQSLLKAGQYRRLYNLWGTMFGIPTDNYSAVSEGNSLLARVHTKGVVTPASAGTTSFTVEVIAQGYNSAISYVSLVGDTVEFRNDVNGAHSPVAAPGTSGLTINIITNGSPTTQARWELIGQAASALTPGTYFEYDSSAGSFYRYFIIDDVGTDPAVPGRTAAPIRLEGSNTDVEVTYRIAQAVEGLETTRVTPTVAALISPGNSWNFSTLSKNYYNWFTMDGVGTDPLIPSRIGVRTDLFSTMTVAEIVLAIIDSISPLLWNVPDTRGYFPRYWDHGAGKDPDAGSRIARGDGVGGDHVGTTQDDSVGPHSHEYITVDSLTDLAPGGDQAYDTTKTETTTSNSTTGSESRPKNIYFFKIAKY